MERCLARWNWLPENKKKTITLYRGAKFEIFRKTAFRMVNCLESWKWRFVRFPPRFFAPLFAGFALVFLHARTALFFLCFCGCLSSERNKCHNCFGFALALAAYFFVSFVLFFSPRYDFLEKKKNKTCRFQWNVFKWCCFYVWYVVVDEQLYIYRRNERRACEPDPFAMPNR